MQNLYTVEHAEPNSPLAVRYGFQATGCYVVVFNGQHYIEAWGSERAATERAGELTMRNLPVRRCSIVCAEHPEWGTFGVYEDRGDWYEIHGRSGTTVLFKSEAVQFWQLAA